MTPTQVPDCEEDFVRTSSLPTQWLSVLCKDCLDEELSGNSSHINAKAASRGGRYRNTGAAMQAGFECLLTGLKGPEALAVGVKPAVCRERAGVVERQILVGWIFVKSIRGGQTYSSRPLSSSQSLY